MKQPSLVVGVYALLIAVGGLVGHLTAGSLVSLIASLVIALLLAIGAVRMAQGCRIAYWITTAITAFLTLFFAYRFSIAYKWMPGGMMTLISAAVLVYLVAYASARTQRH